MRGFRGFPYVYFGVPGQYVRLPWPRGGVDASVDRPKFDFVSGSGTHRISSLVATSRKWELSWSMLHQSTFDTINQFWLGQAGAGPFVYIDPSRPNLLSSNQSAACSFWNDATDFGTPTTGALSANKTASFIMRQFGTRSLRWLFTPLVGGTIRIPVPSPYASWAGYPVVPGESYAFSFSAIPDGVITVTAPVGADLRWYTSAGALISTTTLANVTIGGWSRFFVTGIAPSNAAYVLPSVLSNGSSVTAGGSLYIDMLQLEMSGALNDWAPGTGLNPVDILNLSEGIPSDALMRMSPSMTIREVQ